MEAPSGRLYAMERGLKIPQNKCTKTTNSLLISLMKQLEKLEQKQKYATWKAADIRKAVKEGRKPQAGPSADSIGGQLQGRICSRNLTTINEDFIRDMFWNNMCISLAPMNGQSMS
ncbi:protein HOMOLOG OF MAMMALIAN LYST-INTERACTING PROTEIN 5-like [Rosa chinensis]|uniref:protein HOMOLOG OF MAMMALIAN LYST-INTERACTING PROTEIN 5-like n=1 Tax=Rosa chinensis TaxID=74649 RepID=UPI001AD94810|nr:protein HOMOLOG OF MAMMALIAN LYST-INTERACTING PROTEIN 5-like [Rosa chinensis]